MTFGSAPTFASVTYPGLLSSTVFLSQLLVAVLLLLAEVRILLHLGLVQPVDNRVLPLGDMNLLDLMTISSQHGGQGSLCRRRACLLVVLESNLANCHTTILLQI